MSHSTPKRFLCILPERLGDIIFCTPAISLLAELRPTAQIDILSAAPLAAAVLAHNPALHQIHICTNIRQLPPLQNSYEEIFCFHANQKAKAFVEKIGQHCHFGHIVPGRQHQSQAAVNAVAQALLGHTHLEDRPYNLYPTVADKERVEALLRQYIDLANPPILIGCQVGCSKTVKNGFKFWKPRSKLMADKSWDIACFIALVQAIYQQDPSIRILLTGTLAETALLKPLFREANVINLLGKTSVLESAALMSYLDLFVSIDTGTLHLASASGVPLIALMLTESVELTGPFPPDPNKHIIAGDSMKDISVESVLEKISSLFNKKPQAAKAAAC